MLDLKKTKGNVMKGKQNGNRKVVKISAKTPPHHPPPPPPITTKQMQKIYYRTRRSS